MNSKQKGVIFTVSDNGGKLNKTGGLAEYNAARRAQLAAIEVEYPVADIEAAKDPKTILWATTRLIEGDSWEVVRRKMGLGPSHVDRRWREIRKHILEQAVPENEDQTLKDYLDEQAQAIADLKEFILKIEQKIEATPSSKEEQKAHHQYYKYKLDALSKLVDETSKKAQHSLETHKAKKGLAKNIGTQIIIHNNIPRPQRNVPDIETSIKEIDAGPDSSDE